MDDFCQEEHFDGCAIKWGEAIGQLAIELYRDITILIIGNITAD